MVAIIRAMAPYVSLVVALVKLLFVVVSVGPTDTD
jgi:hypothetical protein